MECTHKSCSNVPFKMYLSSCHQAYRGFLILVCYKSQKKWVTNSAYCANEKQKNTEGFLTQLITKVNILG
jgi:hypothetical protein